jgi:hypothetical protein
MVVVEVPDPLGSVLQPVLQMLPDPVVRMAGTAVTTDIADTAATATTNVMRFITQPPLVTETPVGSSLPRPYPVRGHP